MAGPMDGIRVVELGFWVAGPSCGGILADWGADVIKVEPINGDPMRGLMALFGGAEVNPPFELDNRGKRSIGLDYAHEAGKAVLLDLIDRADVFLTNLRVEALERAGLSYEHLKARNPRLVYASVTGLGLEGDERGRPAYDVGSFWARAGVAEALTPEGRELPYQRGGMGDHMTGLAATAGISAALYVRERTGEGQQVATSLLRIGTYMIGWDLNINLRVGAPTVAMSRTTCPNPLINNYTCGDGRKMWLLGLEGDRHWPNVARALGHPEWVEDPRFATLVDRIMNTAELVGLMDAAFATLGRDEWAEVFDREGVWWAPVQASHEFIHDPQAAAARCWVETPLPDGGTARMPATPVDFHGTPWAPSGPCPELGEHTELVLMDLGYDWDRIEQLKRQGAVL